MSSINPHIPTVTTTGVSGPPTGSSTTTAEEKLDTKSSETRQNVVNQPNPRGARELQGLRNMAEAKSPSGKGFAGSGYDLMPKAKSPPSVHADTSKVPDSKKEGFLSKIASGLSGAVGKALDKLETSLAAKSLNVDTKTFNNVKTQYYEKYLPKFTELDKKQGELYQEMIKHPPDSPERKELESKRNEISDSQKQLQDSFHNGLNEKEYDVLNYIRYSPSSPDEGGHLQGAAHAALELIKETGKSIAKPKIETKKPKIEAKVEEAKVDSEKTSNKFDAILASPMKQESINKTFTDFMKSPGKVLILNKSGDLEAIPKDDKRATPDNIRAGMKFTCSLADAQFDKGKFTLDVQDKKNAQKLNFVLDKFDSRDSMKAVCNKSLKENIQKTQYKNEQAELKVNVSGAQERLKVWGSHQETIQNLWTLSGLSKDYKIELASDTKGKEISAVDFFNINGAKSPDSLLHAGESLEGKINKLQSETNDIKAQNKPLQEYGTYEQSAIKAVRKMFDKHCDNNCILTYHYSNDMGTLMPHHQAWNKEVEQKLADAGYPDYFKDRDKLNGLLEKAINSYSLKDLDPIMKEIKAFIEKYPKDMGSKLSQIKKDMGPPLPRLTKVTHPNPEYKGMIFNENIEKNGIYRDPPTDEEIKNAKAWTKWQTPKA